MNRKVATAVGAALLILGAAEFIHYLITSREGGLVGAPVLMLAGASLLRARRDVPVINARMAVVMVILTVILLAVAAAVFLWPQR